MAKTSSSIQFEAKLLRPTEGGDWTFLRLPQEASSQLRSRSMVSVEVSMNGFEFVATLQPDGEGGHWLRVESEWSKGARISVGDTVELGISPVQVEPEPTVPEDLVNALLDHPSAAAVWADITPIARRDWISWLTSGKRAETLHIRLDKMMDMLSNGKRRICCFDRSGIVGKNFSCPAAADE